MNYGELLAKQFDVPERPKQVAARQPRAATGAKAKEFKLEDFGLKAPEGLDRSTPDAAKFAQEYYQEVGALQQFAKTMQVRYGVDVMAPDPRNPDSIWAAEAFKQRLGLLLDGVDRAKNDLEMFKQQQQATFRGEFLPSTEFGGSRSMSPVTQQGQVLYKETPFSQQMSEGVLDITKQEAEQLRQRNMEFANQSLAKAEEAKANGDMGSYNYFMQEYNTIMAKTPMAKQDTTPRPSAWEFNFGQKQKTGFDEITRIVNHKKGIWKSAKTSDYFDQGTYWVEPEDTTFVNTDIGSVPDGTGKSVNATIKQTVMNPQTGEVRWVFKEEGVPPMRIDNLDAKTIADYLKGVNQLAVDEFLASNPEVLSQGRVVDDAFIASKDKQTAEQVRTSVAKVALSEAEQAQAVADEVKSLKNWWLLPNQRLEKPSRVGVLSIMRLPNSENFTIENIRELVPNQKEEYYQKFDNMSLTQLPKLLKQLGVMQSAQQAAQPTAPQGKTVSRATIKSKIGTPGFEGYTEQELINYYQGLGYTIQ